MIFNIEDWRPCILLNTAIMWQLWNLRTVCLHVWWKFLFIRLLIGLQLQPTTEESKLTIQNKHSYCLSVSVCSLRFLDLE